MQSSTQTATSGSSRAMTRRAMLQDKQYAFQCHRARMGSIYPASQIEGRDC